MSSRRLFSSLLAKIAAVASLAILLAAIPAMAQTGGGEYILLLASGFLCDAGSSACPGVAKSVQGDSYEMSGAGTFSPQSKSVTATGTFTHKSRDGNTLETGIWVASELVSFNSYGIAPGALMKEGQAFGPPGFGPRRLPMFMGPMPAGGLAVLRIRLLPMRGAPRTALLQVNCALGKVPAERQREGIRLSLEGNGGEFDEELGGRTLFVLTSPGAGGAVNPSTPRSNPSPPPAQ